MALCMFRDLTTQKGLALRFDSRGVMKAVHGNGFGLVVYIAGPGARWMPVATRPPQSSCALPPGACISAWHPGTMRGAGAPALRPGRNRRPFSTRSREQKAPRGPGRTLGVHGASARRGRRRENFPRGRCGGARALGRPSRRDAPHNSRAERGKAGPPRPRPSRARARPWSRTWWFSFLPPAAAAGPPGPLVMFTYRERVSGLRSVHILRASHTDARLRHSQPAKSLIGGRGRSFGSPPAPGRGGGGAAASGHRRRRPGSSHRAQLAHPAPSGPRRGVGRSGRRTAFPPPPSFPPTERRRRRRQFPAGGLTSRRSALARGLSCRLGGGTKGARVRQARASAPCLGHGST